MHIVFTIIIIVSIPACAFASSITPFTSDGCSSFPDGTLTQKQLWLNCCIAHDFSYWKGGTYTERKEADEALKICVSRVGEPEIAELMLAGVRVGGTPYLPTSFHWGYGWPYPRFYAKLTKKELEEIQKVLQKQSTDLPLVLQPIITSLNKEDTVK